MRSMSGNIRFVRSYPLVSFGHVQNFERTPSDKDVCWVNVSCALVCGLSGSHDPDILYVSVIVHSTRAGERSTSGHVTDKTDKYRMLKGQETHIFDAKRWFLRSKQLTFIILWNLREFHLITNRAADKAANMSTLKIKSHNINSLCV